MDRIEKRRTQLTRFINELYDLTNGSCFRTVRTCEIAKKMRLDFLYKEARRSEAVVIAEYLEGQGLVQLAGTSNIIRLTPEGVRKVEDARSPENASQNQQEKAAVRASNSTAAGSTGYEYDVAISFAGSDRSLAEWLAKTVREAGFRVFYDDYYPEKLWGKNLIESFDDVYRKKSLYCVIFVSPEYVERMWTNYERQSAQARALAEKGKEYILPIEVEPAELPGLPPTTGYLSLKKYSLERIAQILIEKLKGASPPTNTEATPDSPPDPAFDKLLPALRQATSASIVLPAKLPEKLKNVAINDFYQENEYEILFFRYPVTNMFQSYGRTSVYGVFRSFPRSKSRSNEYFEVTNVERIVLPDGTEAWLRYLEPATWGGTQGPHWEGKFHKHGQTYWLLIHSDKVPLDAIKQALSTMVSVT